MTVFGKGFVTILGCAVLLALLAIPLILRKVPRNVVYGYRTRSTLGDDALWYAANAHFGRGLLAASLVAAVAISLLHRAGLAPSTFLEASIAVLLVPLAVATFATARFVRARKRNSNVGTRFDPPEGGRS